MIEPIAFHEEWLESPPHFRLEPILGYLARSANECLFQVNESGSEVTRCIPVNGEKPIVTIGSGTDGRIRLSFRGVAASRMPGLSDSVRQYVCDWLDWHRDMAPFYEMAANDPLLRGPADRFHGLRLVGVPDLFEALGWAILGQQINLAFAYTLKRRLVEAYGDSAVDERGVRHWTFPAAETVAALRPEDLTAMSITTKKAEYLISVAGLVADGSLTKERLLSAGSLREAERTLTSIRGIGPWTAHYVAMRCLRFPDAFPIQDVGLHLAIRKILGTEAKPAIPEILGLSAGWRGWEAYATFFLWRTLY